MAIRATRSNTIAVAAGADCGTVIPLIQINEDCPKAIMKIAQRGAKGNQFMRVHSVRAYLVVGATAACMVVGAQTTLAGQTANEPHFKQNVLPILQEHCSQCHAPGQIGYQAIGLDLRNYRGLMNGSRHGPAVIPRQPQLGALMKVLDWSKPYYLKMPPQSHQLEKQDLDTIKAWIAAGARND